MNNPQSKKTYIYDVGDKDKLRLKILNDVYNPLSQRALLDIGVKDKKCIIDIACGQGAMACWMAKQVGPDGIVIGIDASEEQLMLAEQLAQKEGLSNIRFIKKSVLDVDFDNFVAELPCRPDFIYSRWLLIHLEAEKIKPVMQAFYHLLAPGGVMAHEEATLKESYLDKIAESFKKYVMLFNDLAHKLNINFNLGSDLLGLFTEVGYKQPQFKICKPKFTSEQLYFFQLDLESAIPMLEKFNLAKKSDVDILNLAIEQDLHDGFDMTMTNYFVYGIK
ncbi:MAG: class I SAM-dependent methyltransferase [Gammaproteobacteria bacterium]